MRPFQQSVGAKYSRDFHKKITGLDLGISYRSFEGTTIVYNGMSLGILTDFKRIRRVKWAREMFEDWQFWVLLVVFIMMIVYGFIRQQGNKSDE